MSIQFICSYLEVLELERVTLSKQYIQNSSENIQAWHINPDLLNVLLLAPTGVAAIDIGGPVINSLLGIPRNVCTEHVVPLPHERLSTLRCKLSGLKLIIIDEISMVYNRLLKYIHERLKQIFGTSD